MSSESTQSLAVEKSSRTTLGISDAKTRADCRAKKLRKSLIFLFTKNGFNEREVRHEKDDEVLVSDFLASNHFKDKFNEDDFENFIAKNNTDINAKEEPHLVFVCENGRELVRYIPDGLVYVESKELKEEAQDDEVENEKHAANANEHEEKVVETKDQKKKSKKKKPAGSTTNTAGITTTTTTMQTSSDYKSPTEEVKSSTVALAPVESGLTEVKNKKKSKKKGKSSESENDHLSTKLSDSSTPVKDEKQDKNERKKNKEDVKVDSSNEESSKAREKVNVSSSDHQEKILTTKLTESVTDEENTSVDKAEVDTKANAEKISKKKMKQSKPDAEKNEQKNEGKQSSGSDGKQSSGNEGKQSSGNEGKQSSGNEGKEIEETKAGLKQKSSDEENSSEIENSPTAKKPKKKTEEAFKKIPKLFNYLFAKDGLKDKEIAVSDDDGFVEVKKILFAYQDQYTYTEKEVEEALRDNNEFVMRKSNGQIFVKAAEQVVANTTVPVPTKTEQQDVEAQHVSGHDGDDWEASVKRKPRGDKQTGDIRQKQPGSERCNYSNNNKSKGDLFHLSKTMSYLLRHGAAKERLHLSKDGFLSVDELLNCNSLKSYTESDVVKVVQENDKQRFFLATDEQTGKLKVRANQGHTVEVPDLDLKEISNSEEAPVVIHGTYQKSWKIIQQQGLNNMGRTHIHFAAGEPGDDGVISGMRSTCDILIFIDLEKALADGIKFYRSANNVILCPGDQSGVLLPKYFKSVVQRSPRVKLM